MNKEIVSTTINMLNKVTNTTGGSVWALAKAILRFLLLPEVVKILLIKTFIFFNELGDVIYEVLENSQNPYIQKSLKYLEANITPYLISFGLVSPYDEWTKDNIHNYHDEYEHLHPWQKIAVDITLAGTFAIAIHDEIKDPTITKFLPRLSFFNKDSLSGTKAPVSMAVAA